MVFMQEDMHLHTHSLTYVSHKYFAGVVSTLPSSTHDASGAPWCSSMGTILSITGVQSKLM